MKKILFCAAMVAAMLFTACGSKSEKTEDNAKIQEMVDLINAKAAEEGNAEFTASVRGNDIVLTGEVDESDLPGGMSVKALAAMLNAAGDEMSKMFAAELMSDMDDEDRMMIEFLRENKANLIFHFIGQTSGEEGEFTLRYDQLPE